MLKYRREIDGLRAIAVLSVIFFHAGFKVFKAGYVGVDVFFVISGFLITTILLDELNHKSFSIVNFYERRARRILPALFFIMAVCVFLSWFILMPKDLVSFFQSLIAIPLFGSNFFFWKDVDYFATASEVKPLIHTWSLAVEEQYYILFPYFLLLVWRFGKRFIFIALFIIATISLTRAQIISSYLISENFFLLPTRFWEISIGAMIAFYPTHRFSFHKLWNQFLSVLGVFLILYSIFNFGKNTPFPSVYALVPTIGTALTILFADENTIVGKALGHDLLVKIGLISYSAYLWHQPIFAFSRYAIKAPYLNSYVMLALSVMSLLLAWLSWRHIEAPLKNKEKFNRSFIFKFSISGSMLFIAVGLLFSNIFKNYDTETMVAKHLVNHKVSFSSAIQDERVFIRNRIYYEIFEPEILIIGSSRIMQITNPPGAVQRKYLGLGVSGASVEDDIAIMYMVGKKFSPPNVLIGADPWLFNAKSAQDRWRSLELEYSAKSTSQESNKFVNFLRDSYEASTYSLGAPTDDTPEFKSKIRQDGSHVYDVSYLSRTQTDIESDFTTLLNYSMKDYVFSEKAKNEFENLVQTSSKRSRVVLILTPYHPKLYQRMKNERPIFLSMEEEFRALAKRNNIDIVGSYNPLVSNCTAEEFYDGMHPKETCMRKILDPNNL